MLLFTFLASGLNNHQSETQDDTGVKVNSFLAASSALNCKSGNPTQPHLSHIYIPGAQRETGWVESAAAVE